jgi:hypothetical protein
MLHAHYPTPLLGGVETVLYLESVRSQDRPPVAEERWGAGIATLRHVHRKEQAGTGFEDPPDFADGSGWLLSEI